MNTAAPIRSVGVSSARALPRATSIRVSAVAVFAFAVATALSAQLVIPLPHTPVPVTLQTLVVTLAGLALGTRRGVASMALYLALGAIGFHVFSAGTWGLQTLFGATGGYLLGFVLAQPLLAWLVPAGARGWRVWARAAGATVAAHAVIFAAGVVWLADWMGVDLQRALELGFVPFVSGWPLLSTLGKCLAATLLVGPALALRRRVSSQA